jgi:structural maintenance of chromosome 4
MTQAMTQANEGRHVRRLIIKRMELENFKSYAGVQHIGPFHKFFSSIVGPNGSGKSNVIDALLFVFGFKASKIRLKRVSELVHSSAKFPNLTMARVTVHFTEILDLPGEEYEEVANTHFAITRTAHSDNKSEYFLNDRRSTFAEVTAQLRSKGIDLDHNRFLILQGEVEAISQMPPKARNENETGMLEYLEDIIGTASYKDQIEAAAKQVEELGELRDSALNLVKASQKDRDTLQTAKTEAELYLRLEVDYHRAQSLSHQITAHRLQQRRKECHQTVQEMKAKYDAQKKEMKSLEDEVEQADKEWKAYKQELDSREKAAKKSADLFAKVERKRTELQEDMKNGNKKVQSIQKGIKKDETSLKMHQNSLDVKERELVKTKAELEELGPQLEKHEQEMKKTFQSMQAELEPLRKTLEEKKKAIMPYKKQLNEADSQLQVLESEKALFSSKQQEAAKKLEAEKEASARLTEELSAAESELATLSQRLQQLEKEQKARLKQCQAAAKNREAAEARYRESFRKFEELKASAMSDGNQSSVVEYLMRMKRNGTLPGVHGRLGDLGSIDPKYDIAISTACPQLNFMVVEDVQTGQQCLDLLRRDNVGRCTVIILEKQQHLNSRAHSGISCPEGVPRLYDLINIKNDQYRVAFYWALHDTLAAHDIDQATRIAFSAGRRWRVVTLDGKLIETSGTMSGGGRPQKGLMSGRLKEQVSPQELKESEQQVAAYKQQFDECIREEERLQQEDRAAQAEMQQVTGKIKKLDAQLQSKRVTLADIEKSVAVLTREAKKAASAEDAQELQRLDGEIAKHAKKRDAVKQSMQRMEEEVADAEKKMDDCGGVTYKALKHKVKSTKEKLAAHTKAVTELQVSIKKGKTDIDKLEKKIKKDKDELVKAEATDGDSQTKLEKLEKEYVKHKAEHDKLKTDVTNCQALRGDFEDKLRAKKKEKEAKHTTLVDWEHRLKKNETELNHMDGQLQQFENRINEIDAQLQKTFHKYGTEFLPGGSDVGDSQSQPQAPEDSDEEATPQKRVGRGLKRKAASTVVLPQLTKKRKSEAMTTRIDPERLQEYDLDKVRVDVTIYEENLRQMSPNLEALAEWKEKNEDYKRKMDRLEKATQARSDKQKECETLKKQRYTQFMKAFQAITMKLKEMYQMLTLGGDADLELVDNLDPFSEGIIFSVRPNKKAWKQISNLSGGEKTLSSLALVFALHHFNPSPLYFLDEIDAALDFKNVSIVGHYIKEQAQNAQFIIISLRNNMFELANHLVGIYKTSDCTKSVAINPSSFNIPVHQAV